VKNSLAMETPNALLVIAFSGRGVLVPSLFAFGLVPEIPRHPAIYAVQTVSIIERDVCWYRFGHATTES